MTSTDQALESVIIDSEAASDGTYASLRIREAFQGDTENTQNDQGVKLVDANAFMGTNLVIGDVDAAENIDTFTATSATNVELHEEINGVES